MTAFTVKTLASRWDVSEKTIYNMIAKGDLRPIVGIAHHRIALSEVERAERGCSDDSNSTGASGQSSPEAQTEPKDDLPERLTARKLKGSSRTSKAEPHPVLEQLSR